MKICKSAALMLVLSLPLLGCGSSGAADPVGGNAVVACNVLALSGPEVPATRVAAVAPVPAGGAIADGVYVLTSWKEYTGPAGETGPTPAGDHARELIQFEGSTTQANSNYSDGDGKDSPISETYVLSGTDIEFTINCGHTLGTEKFPYTSTGVTVQLFSVSPERVTIYEYTKE